MEERLPIKVYIITGFLGAGKTTLLNNLLQQYQDRRNIVIENEFGKVNIDASLVTQQTDTLYELTSGCICCSLDNDLLEVLGDILQLEQRPDQLFIETTGIADAGNIIGMFQMPQVKKHYALEKTICVADAENVRTRLEQTPETGRQLACADVVVINKTGSLTVPELVTLYQELEAINPLAFYTATENGQLSVADLHRAASIARPAAAGAPLTGGHKINSVLFESSRPFDLDRLLYVLDFHFNVYPDQLYRIKGYVALKGEQERFLLQSTGRYLHLTPAGSWGNDAPASVLVFIGRELKTATIERILQPALK
ncbi:CobW family GTP-binding protein [Chitinophaga solisilvae]|uniref:GTP-binding protein n=1 Tax=Chitinophaga solisilvae TaxID=1233460 RepID=A0A3S1D519_9BACT|nr:GTP-binding protein [Chitinophaga solisilvae]NSL85389.1 GTP-binding protein [Chitinophaga solisilvae]